MGVLRAGTETEPPSDEAVGPGSTPSPWSARRRRWVEVAAFALAAAALFAVYLRLSRTVPENSDEANVLLVASDMLHGNLLLHGWYLTDVSFYTTEVPQYALLEIFFGVHPDTAHIAAAMTYTLAVVLAVLLARGGFTSRAAVIRLLIAAGIILAPQLGPGVTALILTIGHIGTAVPVLLIFLLLDRAPERWWVPVLTGLGLAWVLIADQLVLIVGGRAAGRGLRPAGPRGGSPGAQPVPRLRHATVRPVPDRGGGRGRRARLGGRAGTPGPRRLHRGPGAVRASRCTTSRPTCTPCGPCRRSSEPTTAGWPGGPITPRCFIW